METTFPTKVKIAVLNPNEWHGEQLAWINANNGQIVTGKMENWDEFRPDNAPLVLYEDEYEVVESTTEPPDFAKT